MIDGNGATGESVAFPLKGQLLSGLEALEWIRAHIRLRAGRVAICSAFVRAPALRAALDSVHEDLSGEVLVRWKAADLAAGASDFDAYFVAKERGLRFFMRTDFHGKVYLVPGQGIIVGSANATANGFALAGGGGNAEICTLVNDSANNRAVISGLFDGATEVDDELLLELKAWVESQIPGHSLGAWPLSIMERLSRLPTTTGLLVDECLLSDGSVIAVDRAPTTEDERHDFRLLGIPCDRLLTEGALQQLRSELPNARIVKWLGVALRKMGGEGYFGSLTESLHTTLLDDPAPRRFEVKRLLQNLLGWISAVGLPGFHLDRPKYSQRVLLAGHPPN